MRNLAIISTHPIQYYAPIFQLLAKKFNVKVFYTWGILSLKKYDPGFKKVVEWDIPLLEGYPYIFEKNTARNPGSNYFNGIANPELIEHIIEFAPDAILVFGWAYKSHFNVMRFFKGKIPIFFRGDSTLLDNSSGFKGVLKSTIRRFWLRIVYNKIDIALYVGEANKAYFKWVGLKESQLVFAPHAIDNQRFAKDHSREASAMRQQLLIPEDATVVLFAAKLESKKDPLILLQAFARINIHDCYLVMVGMGILQNEISEFITSNKLSNKVRLMGFQNQLQMPTVYQMADIFCLPSKGPGETWGLAVNEAMACSRPVLVSNKVGCYPNLVNIKTGWVFEGGKQEDLISKLSVAISDKSILKQMGESAYNHINNFSFKLICDAMETAFEKT